MNQDIEENYPQWALMAYYQKVKNWQIIYFFMKSLFNPYPLSPPIEPEDYLVTLILTSLFLYPVICACIPKLSCFGRERIIWWGCKINLSLIGGFFIYLLFPSIQESVVTIIPVLLILYLIYICLTMEKMH